MGRAGQQHAGEIVNLVLVANDGGIEVLLGERLPQTLLPFAAARGG